MTGYLPIAEYGIIGDLNTVALVGTSGAIDFLCFPDLDSPSIFAALLDRHRGGSFRIAPADGDARYGRRQLYLPDTNVLLTRFLAADGVFEICDFMPIRPTGAGGPRLIRRVTAVHGRARIRIHCDPQFDYGRRPKYLRVDPDGSVRFEPQGQPDQALRLSSVGDGDPKLRIRNGAAVGELVLEQDQHRTFVLEAADAVTDATDAAGATDDGSAAMADTIAYWQDWLGRSGYRGRWREMVNRSALVLKLLTAQRHGSIAAAATFGLPEEIGGERNYDYRFAWIRDASFTVHALMRLGFADEAAGFMDWVQARCTTAPPGRPLAIMYQLDGGQELTEQDLPHFEGYRRSRPVRIGNGAYDQRQHDIYGELMDAVFLYYDRHGGPRGGLTDQFWSVLSRLMDHVCEVWQTPDAGIWEVRGGDRHFLYSRLMCWVALDRAVTLAADTGRGPAPARWTAARDAIAADIHETFWDADAGTFVQHKGARTVDASTLLMPIVRFIDARDVKWRKTLAAIERMLVEDSLVYRYDVAEAAHDGFAGGEATFNLCTFWYVECLARSGQLAKARLVFEKMLTYANHVGLYAEETDRHGDQLGNFPQAFTHLGLISAATYLDRALDRAAERGTGSAPP